MKNIIYVLIISIVLLVITIALDDNKVEKYNITSNANKLNRVNYKEVDNTKYIANLKIDKINLDRKIADKYDKNNNVDKNVTIAKSSIMPDSDSSLVLLYAHSGIGNKAYFNDLDKLEINDEIVFTYNNYDYKYKVKDIYYKLKTGTFTEVVIPNKKQLILITCDKKSKDKNLVVKAEL